MISISIQDFFKWIITGDERQQETKTKGKRLRPWFLAGFLIVFVGMGLWFHSLGVGGAPGTLRRTNLFQYYYLETGAWLRHSGELSAVSPSLTHVMITLGFYLVCAAVGGVLFMGIGWVIRKFSCRATNSI
ncbi:hypothetical protein [Gimesia algae]|uniref:hypothetical protein n=1 Tax=Gimesia algae TaxID=2527971 RepID=UPI001E41D8F5|nr:hypothetical protein [Gimesia algae]